MQEIFLNRQDQGFSNFLFSVPIQNRFFLRPIDGELV